MKIIIRLYQTPFIGNIATDEIEIPSNRIYVSMLKSIWLLKYKIPTNEQRLTLKISNWLLITLTDDWPLTFFRIKNNSQIYLEHIKPFNKNEEVLKKILNSNSTKLKYLKQWGLLSKKKHNSDSNRLGTILESQNEYNDDYFSQRKQSQITTFTKEEIWELIIHSIKQSQLTQFCELMEQYEFSNEINTLSQVNGYNLLHTACFFGFTDIAKVIVEAYHGDVNYVNVEKFTPLHWAVMKGHYDWTKYLLSWSNVDVNCWNNNVGTPWHIACKKGSFKMVSLLVCKCQLDIVDINGKIPLDICIEWNCRKWLCKWMHREEQVNKKERDLQRGDKVSDSEVQKYPFWNQINFIPPKPPRAIGFWEKMGKMLPVYRYRFIEIDPMKGYMKRYKNKEDYPRNPNIMYTSKEKYRVNSWIACNKWIEVINASVIYTKLWQKMSSINPSITEYLLRQKTNIIIINGKTGTIQDYPRHQESGADKINKHTEKKKKIKSQIPKIWTTSNKEPKWIDDSSLTLGITFSSFDILDLLGAGTFGKVFKVKLKNSYNNKYNINTNYAMKVINKRYLIRNDQLRYAITECNVLKQANSPFIIKLVFSFQTLDYLYMILDYCPGGDWSYHIINHLFEEEEAKFYIAELILAIEHLHLIDVIYRDLKPENILIGDDGHIKLADFGLAKENINDGNLTKSFCGSPAYLSPEMWNRRGVGKSADVYGIGAVWYEMMCGTPPFYADDIGKLFKNISKNKLVLHDYFSPAWKDWLKKLLNREPNNRIGVINKEEIKDHVFFKGIDWDALEKKEIKPPWDLVGIKYENDEGNKNNDLKKKALQFKDIDYTKENKDIRRIRDFTFVRKDDDFYE